MDSTRRNVEALVERFVRNSSDEDERFEAKALAKLESKEGRQEIVKRLTAMANTEGGTMLLGIAARPDGTAIVETLPAGSERARDLMAIANDRTQTCLVPFLRMSLEDVAGGRILVINITRCDDGLIQWQETGSGERWRAYKKAGSTTQAMSPDDITRRIRQQLARRRRNLIVSTSVQAPRVFKKRLMPVSPPLRGITEAADHVQPVFSTTLPLEEFDRACFYHLDSHIGLGPAKTWQDLFAAAVQHLGVKLDYEFGYSIKSGRRIQMGHGHRALLEDVSQIEAVATRLREASPAAPPSMDTRPSALVTAYGRAPGGLMWIQAEYQGEGHWFHQELGFVLEDIPFRLQAFHQFADAAGIEPFSFRQDTHLQGFHLNLQAPLKRPIHRPHGTGRFDMLYVEGDNPFYRQPEALREAADDGVPQHYLDHFASIPRLLAQVRGGLVPADNKFTLVHVEAIHLGLREETYLMHAMVGAR